MRMEARWSRPGSTGWHDGQAILASAFQKLEAKAAEEPAEDDERDED
jgi:hypothetical protein